MAQIGKHIRRARVEQGLSQTAVAEKLGTNQAMVSQWETGKKSPKPAELDQLRRVLDIKSPGRRRKGAEAAQVPAQMERAFGRWLERTRTDAGLSVPELAEKSGVSAVAIYNIEAGKSRNPRVPTRQKLERALKQVTPDEVVEASEESSAIEGLGPLEDFDPHDKKDRPSCSGVYVFYDVSERPVYVGKGENIARRVRDHEEKFWFKAPIVANAAYIEIAEANLRHQVEQVLIKFLKSNAVINKQSVDR